MAFGGEMNQRIDARAKQRFNLIRIANIALLELHPVKTIKVGTVPGIGQRIEHDDGVAWLCRPPMPDEVGPDETRTTGDKQFSHSLYP